MEVDKFVDDENVHHKTSNNHILFYSHVHHEKNGEEKFHKSREENITHEHTTE
jgi:hypothetical protein